MGVDIYSESGILFPVDEAVKRFFKRIPNAKVKKIVQEIETIIDEGSEFRKSLQTVGDCASLRCWFVQFAESDIQDDYLANGDILETIWDKITLHTEFKNLPEVSFKYFTSNRYSGYDVPTETVCVVFSDFGLFETKLTKKGQKVSEIMKIKNLKQTNWTVYSY